MQTFEQVEIRRATSMADYLFLRDLRNRVRQFMSNYTGLIGYTQQLRFYLNTPANVEIFIAWVGSKRAAYLLLRRQAETTLITEAVGEPYRGRGIASRLVRFAQERHSDLTAEILASNTASIRLHQTTGFTLAGVEDGVQTFRFIRSRPCEPVGPHDRLT